MSFSILSKGENLYMKFLFFILLIPLVAFSQDGCKVENKLSKPLVKCRDRSGFLDLTEKINIVFIEYKINGVLSRIDINDISASDLISESRIKYHLSKLGVKNPEQIKVTNVSLEFETPLYKDPETKVLASGCHYTYAPTIISYGKGEVCGDFICNSEVECKTGKTSKRSDAFCRASISTEGARCPRASGCLSDNSIQIEKYRPSSGGSRGRRSSHRGSKGTQQ